MSKIIALALLSLLVPFAFSQKLELGEADTQIMSPMKDVLGKHGIPDKLSLEKRSYDTARVSIEYADKFTFVIDADNMVIQEVFYPESKAAILGVTFDDSFTQFLGKLGEPAFYNPGCFTYYEITLHKDGLIHDLGFEINTEDRKIIRMRVFIDEKQR